MSKVEAADTSQRVDFDEFAGNYDAALDRGLSLSGEDKDFFSRGRVEWLKSCLGESLPTNVLDFGCGTGGATSLLQSELGARSVTGIDTSREAIAVAQRAASESVCFQPLEEYRPTAEVDVAYCNGVFHHIPLAERASAIRLVWDSLRPGGVFSFWENNPWNPGTRLVMSRIPFDRDAILVSSREARRLLREGGFEILSTHFLFVFPKLLGALRPLERALTSLPVGAQYQVLCRKALS